MALLLVLLPVARAAGGQLRLKLNDARLLLHVEGAAGDEWRFQTSSDLVTWSNASALGTVWSGTTNVGPLVAGSPNATRQFYRAVKTAGLYDVNVLRTLHLTFTQSNWRTLLTAYKASGSNLLATLSTDGKEYAGVGVRYRGNTSYTMSGQKKSLNIEIDWTDPSARLMGYKTVNLNNAFGDETIMREPLYFNVMRRYAVCPSGSSVKLYINGEYWGVYSFAQQQDGDLVREWFPSNDGDRWRAPNMGGGGGPGGPGGGFGGGASALTYLGTNLATYQRNYELKTDHSTNAWQQLLHATEVLNKTPTNQLRDRVEEVLAVDRWLWFLALENTFADEDSYYFKGADYMFYYEPESGRLHPIEHDGNESSTTRDVSLNPFQGATGTNRPVISRLLAVPELRQRYCAHLRTVLEESFNPTALNPLVDHFRALTEAAINADTKKGFTMATYASDVAALKNFIRQRREFLTNHAELRPVPPLITTVWGPTSILTAKDTTVITAEVHPNGANGLDSVWLYHRGKSYGRFVCVRMFDDGAHGDGLANDSVFGAAIAAYPAGTRVRYYVEARSANTAKAASFAPARAEEETFGYRVALTAAANTPVVINELMASNTATLVDPQGEYDDWIELRNLTDLEVDLTGRYLSDEADNPRKWAFPAGTKIPPDGFLLVWADEDGAATPGLHASFKLSAAGEQLFLTDTDVNLNAVLDSVTFGPQAPDLSYGRLGANPDVFYIMLPTPGRANQ
jgi:spore coat protein CotH